VIRTQRVKLGISQAELGNALGVTFQQIQKYEQGTNAVASTRIADLLVQALIFDTSLSILELTPNKSFGVISSARHMRVALKLEDASPALRQQSTPCSTRCQSDKYVRPEHVLLANSRRASSRVSRRAAARRSGSSAQGSRGPGQHEFSRGTRRD
jgi:transcriptional regulator with XRE-family HTH domain